LYKADGNSDATATEAKTKDAEAEAPPVEAPPVEAPPEDDWCYLQAGVDKGRCDILSRTCMFVEKDPSSVPLASQSEDDDKVVSSSCAVTLVVALGIAALP
jgi:hypothetical protein